MIFEGQGCGPIVRQLLEKSSLLENWQLKNGLFQKLYFQEKSISHLSCDRAILDDSNFSNSSLKNCEFSQSHLQMAMFMGSSLEKCSWISCQMRGSSWLDLSIAGGQFKGCSAPRMIMEGVRLKDFIIYEPEISHGIFSSLSVISSRFSATHESGITGIRNSHFRNCIFIGCSFSGNILASSTLKDSLFLGCSFRDIDWNVIGWDNTNFIDCSGNPGKTGPLEKQPLKLAMDWTRFEQEVLCG